MKFATVRSAMFQIHMWVGLILGLLLALLGLSGSILVYDDYAWRGNYADQGPAHDRYMAKRGYTIMELPTGQGMVIKR